MPATDGLSAAEAYVLISLPRFDARKALKLGLMGLLAQRVLAWRPKTARAFSAPGISRICMSRPAYRALCRSWSPRSSRLCAPPNPRVR